MKYNFDERVERRNTNCIKWDTAERSYGDKDIIPLWMYGYIFYSFIGNI